MFRIPHIITRGTNQASSSSNHIEPLNFPHPIGPIQENYRKVPGKCKSCTQLQFLSIVDLSTHASRYHLNYTPIFVCFHCPAYNQTSNFTSMLSFIQHIEISHSHLLNSDMSRFL